MKKTRSNIFERFSHRVSIWTGSTWAFITALGVILVWRCYLLLVAQVGMGYVYNAFDTRVDSILMGCLMALSIERDWFGRVTSVVAARSWFPLVTLALLMTSQQGGDAWAKGPGFSVDSVLLSVFVIQVLACRIIAVTTRPCETSNRKSRKSPRSAPT